MLPCKAFYGFNNSRERSSLRPVSWTQVFVSTIFICFVLAEEVHGDENCPVSSPTLYAYTSGDVLHFSNTFNPLIKTDIDLVDKLLTSSKKVVCDWLVRSKAEHTAEVTIEDFRLVPYAGTKHGDCLEFYDGETTSDAVLGRLCGGDITGEASKTYKASGRFLFVVYKQGEITGYRSFRMRYIAEPAPKEMLLKIAGIVCGSLATIAIVFLVCKFTRYCQPCRKQCCPDEERPPAARTQRELSPLAPPPPPENAGIPARGAGVSVPAGQARVERDGEGEMVLPPDEAPPSYDEIFGSAEEGRNKLN